MLDATLNSVSVSDEIVTETQKISVTSSIIPESYVRTK